MTASPTTIKTKPLSAWRARATCLALATALGLMAHADAQPPTTLQTTPLSIGQLGETQAENPADERETDATSIHQTNLAPSGSNLRLTLDLATRFTWDDTRDEAANTSFVGVDLLHVFSGSSGDRATLTVQGFFTHADASSVVPQPREEAGEWFLEYRILNLNINLLDQSRLNLRLGHFELPFGLEQNINTNGTLRQFSHVANLGFKTDWGASLNGILHGVDYEVGLTRGSGNEWLNRERPWIVSGRLGVKPKAGLSVGVAGFSGEVLDINTTVRRERLGLDVEQELGPLTLLGEVSLGHDEDREVFNTLAEVNWRTRHEDLLVYLQHRFFDIDTPNQDDPATGFAFGARWIASTHWALSAAVEQDTDQPAGSARGRRWMMQARYRF